MYVHIGFIKDLIEKQAYFDDYSLKDLLLDAML